jgi:hypothetical protein
MKTLNTISSLFLLVILGGCANSPVALMNMSSEELKTVSNGVLCRAATGNDAIFNPSSDWEIQNEVRRRGINCGPLRSNERSRAEGMEMMRQGLEIMKPQQRNNSDGFVIGPKGGMWQCRNGICTK